MRLLLIDERVRRQMKAAMERARAKPLPVDELRKFALPDKPHLKLTDRTPGFQRTIASENVLIPRGYRAAISFEMQPVGVCAHLSISVDRPGQLPAPEAVEMILEAFGLEPLKQSLWCWTEEFEPGHSAINVLQLIGTGAVGHA